LIKANALPRSKPPTVLLSLTYSRLSDRNPQTRRLYVGNLYLLLISVFAKT